jgi:hypothetical protein
MRARVSVWTIEGDDLESVTPIEPPYAGQWIRVLAGPEGGPGEESFDLLVCTPTWLANEVSNHVAIVGRHHLIVEKWDAARVREIVTDLFTREQGKDWDELALRLGRLGYWEFEDYKALKPDAHRAGQQ